MTQQQQQQQQHMLRGVTRMTPSLHRVNASLSDGQDAIPYQKIDIDNIIQYMNILQQLSG